MNLKQEKVPPMMASDTASPSSGVLAENLTGMMSQLIGLANDYLELATLETRLTVTTALGMVVIAIITAIVLVTAWLALAGAAVVGLIGMGLSPLLAMLLLAAANVLLAVAGWLQIRHMRHSLGWPVLQRAIKSSSVGDERGDEKRGDE